MSVEAKQASVSPSAVQTNQVPKRSYGFYNKDAAKAAVSSRVSSAVQSNSLKENSRDKVKASALMEKHANRAAPSVQKASSASTPGKSYGFYNKAAVAAKNELKKLTFA